MARAYTPEITTWFRFATLTTAAGRRRRDLRATNIGNSNQPQGFGVQFAHMPYAYRGTFGYDDAAAGSKYAADVQNLIEYGTSGRVAAFIAESIQGVGGVVPFPDGYLQDVYAMVRAAGGICIADEVQSGFGRTGEKFWGFELQGVVPDIVTMAKSIGNGCPLAAVVTTPQDRGGASPAGAFPAAFGGGPVACAQALAVPKVIERRENTGARAKSLRTLLRTGLLDLMARHQQIGDVRGFGLLQGVELVRDRLAQRYLKQDRRCACWNALEKWDCCWVAGDFTETSCALPPPMCLGEDDLKFLLAVL